MPRLPYAELETVSPDLIELRPPENPAPEASDLPAMAYFVQHARRSELRVAYKALVGLLVGEQGLEGPEAEAAHRMYLALQRELDRRLQASIQPCGGETPLPF